MAFNHAAVGLYARFLITLRPTGCDASHAAHFLHALLYILREDCTATVGLDAAHLNLAANEDLSNTLLHHFHLAVIADDSVKVKVLAILIEHRAYTIVCSLFFRIANC